MTHSRVKDVIAKKASCYLITNRSVAGRMLLKTPEKQKLKNLLFAGTAKFCYSVIDYVIMDNYFHLVIKVHPSSECSEEELLKRYRIYKKNEEARFVSDAQREEFRYNAHDISLIIGNFEQRFVQWFNKEHNSWGHFFGARFDSEMFEVSEHSDALLRVMAYVTLNPVRAGMVLDPKDYHFCGYADRLAHGSVGDSDHDFFDLFCRGIEAKSIKDKKKHFRAYMLGLNRFKSVDSQTLKEFFKEINFNEELHWDDLFIHKCRFFTKCLVIGSESFVRDKLSQFSDKMKWKRSHEPYTEDEWDDIYSLKPIRVNSS